MKKIIKFVFAFIISTVISAFSYLVLSPKEFECACTWCRPDWTCSCTCPYFFNVPISTDEVDVYTLRAKIISAAILVISFLLLSFLFNRRRKVKN